MFPLHILSQEFLIGEAHFSPSAIITTSSPQPTSVQAIFKYSHPLVETKYRQQNKTMKMSKGFFSQSEIYMLFHLQHICYFLNRKTQHWLKKSGL